MKTFKQLLEALTPEQKDSVDKYWQKGDHSWSNHAFPEGSERTHVPLEFPDHKSAHQSNIESHLKSHGIHVHDYIGGFGTDKHGRQVSIGKALVKTKAEPHLVNGFANDPVRQQLKAFKDYHVVVSKHPHDIAGMTSSGQSWENESCMNFSKGSYREYLKEDVLHGTHAAYLVHKDDKDIEKPLARIALKPFHDKGKTRNDIILRPERRTYGNAPDAFSHTVNRWVNKHFPGKEDGIYTKDNRLYNDSGEKFILGEKSFDRALKHEDTEVRVEAFKNPNLTKEHIDIGLNHKSWNVRQAAMDHPNATKEHIDKGLGDKEEGVRYSAIVHPNATKEQLDRGMNDPAPNIRMGVLSNQNVTKEHLDKAFDDDFVYVRSMAAGHPKATKEHLDRALDDIEARVRVNAVLNPNATKEHLHKGLQDGAEIVHIRTLQNPNITHEHLDRALQDHFVSVRSRVFSKNINVTKEHLDKGMQDKDSDVRYSAVAHPNATKEHFDKGIEDEDVEVRTNTLRNPNSTEEHIDKGLKDENWTVRRAALRHHKATERHFMIGLKDVDDDVRLAARDRIRDGE